MTDCTIRIKIGDQEIILDPGAHIKASDFIPLVKTIPADKLRSLYGQLKEHITLDNVLTDHQTELIDKGKQDFEELINDNKGDKFTTLLGAIRQEQDPSKLQALTAYASSLDAKEILDHGNFKIDARDTYKASPYSHELIRRMIFKSDGSKVKLFDELRGLTGMDTLKMSIAYATHWNGEVLDEVKGAYISPDNIVQIVVPSKRKDYHIIGTSRKPVVGEKNIGQLGRSEAQDVILHEMMHAVYSEMYQTDSTFKNKVDHIHQALLDDFTKKGKTNLVNTYADVHEFIASAFESVDLQNALARVQVAKDIDLSLFDAFTGVLSDKVTKPNLLSELVQTIGSSLPNIGPEETVDLRAFEHSLVDRKNIFYLDGVDEQEVDDNMSRRDQTDSYYGNNRKAFYANKRFQERWGSDPFVRDSFYKGTIQEPTNEQIDRLYKDDVVLVPWLRYKPAVKGSRGNTVTPGSWQEVGLVVDDKGNAIKGTAGKMRIEPIIRDDKGNIQKTADGHTIEPKTQGFPVMYSNIKKRQVVVAKTNLNIADEFNTPKDKKFNTVSFPYDLVKGIRNLDYNHFDHNANYEEQLKEAQRELDKIKNVRSDTEEKFDDHTFFEQRVEQLTKNIEKSATIKSDISRLYKQYAFSHEQDGVKHMNVSKLDYIAARYTPNDVDNRVYSDQPVFVIKPSKFKTKDGNDSSFSYPNPKLFDLFWDGQIGKEYAKTSEQMARVVTSGDLVRVRKSETFDVKGTNEKAKTKLARWMTVYKRIGNGVMVATPDGKGYIVPFNMIEAYAKNRTTEDYKNSMIDYTFQMAAFNADAFTTKEDGKRGFSKEITHKPMIYNNKYQNKSGDADDEEIAVKKFDKNLDALKRTITPGYSFVRINKRFTNDSGQQVNYTVNGLVLAKADEGLVVLTENRGSVGIESVKYNSRINNGDKSGAEITFLMENASKIKKLYDEFLSEKGNYEENRKTANFAYTKEGQTTLLVDPKLNPHGIKDAYDFYDAINGVTLARLKEGDLVDLQSDKFKLKDKLGNRIPIYRKVLRVLDDGRVIIADAYNKDVTYRNSYTVKAGKPFASYIKADNIARIGFSLGKISQDADTGEYHASQNEELLNRRKTLWEYSKRDRDFNNFTFAKDIKAVRDLNAKPISKDRDYWRYIALTNKVLEPQSRQDKEAGKVDDREEFFLDKDFNKVPRDKAAYVIATFNKGGEDMKYVNRGILVKTEMLYKDIVTMKDGNGRTVFKPKLLEKLYPGDWITTRNAKGEYWDAVIERIESGNIHTLNSDFSTTKVNPNRVYGVRLSARNSRFSGFKRGKELLTELRQARQVTDAKESIKQVKEDAKPENNVNEDEDLPPFSLEANYKSPKSSRRALYTIGSRLKELNPQIQLNYVDSEEIGNLAKVTGYDYNSARAFVLKGQVYINMDKASISDVVHEYAHLFLHSLKYENPDLYNSLINVTNNHSLYNEIARQYSHLEGSDLNEEVFTTVLGEYMRNKLLDVDKENMDNNKTVVFDFVQYTKNLLHRSMNKTGEEVYDLDPTKVLNMSLEEVMNLVGDHIMTNRITDVHRGYQIESTKDIDLIKNDLQKQGYLTKLC
jgi:hypothetical protein